MNKSFILEGKYQKPSAYLVKTATHRKFHK